MSFDWDWAKQYPEILRVCVSFDRTELKNPVKWKYRPLVRYLQKGPQCGLVALAMLMGIPSEKKVDLLFQRALTLGYTFNGEIFSCDFMQALAKDFIKLSKTEIYTGNINSTKIKDFLFSGGYMLVPYDTNKDNSPGFHNGHKAHWCVVSGAVDTGDQVFVLASHGKSQNVAIWPLETLAQSNQQLLEFSPSRQLEPIDYKLPEGGIQGCYGLNNRCVLVQQYCLL